MLAVFQVIAALALSWAHAAPAEPPRPEVQQPAWCRSELDRFALAGMEAHGLSPSAEAAPEVLLRRVSLDLTGLPPTPAETDAFLAEPDYPRLVERLLESPRFGERWASVWLDLARFADTQGYEKDNFRPIWAYRDWVIRAFNDDLPFDRFTIEQLAGDLLPNPTVDQLTATAFHRNTLTNTEGGTDREEFRVKAVLDRVSTTCTVWLGLTAACAQCHDHPTEPVSQRDFYRLMAFFNNTEDNDRDDDRPLLKLMPIGERQRAQALRKRLEEARSQLAGAEKAWHAAGPAPAEDWRELATYTGPLAALRLQIPAAPPGQAVLSHFDATIVKADGREEKLAFAEPEADRSTPGWPVADAIGQGARNRHGWGVLLGLEEHWAIFPLAQPVTVAAGECVRVVLDQSVEGAAPLPPPRLSGSGDAAWIARAHPSDAVLRARAAATSLQSELDTLQETTVPILRELPAAEARLTHVFHRGNWLDPGESVSAGIPSFLPALGPGPADRLALARWLVSQENPLTARVTVNRFWGRLFGAGLVETEGDFGRTGAEPSNQPLLDWLSVHFATDWHWSVKRLLREMVLSATYRQSSAGSYTSDPANRWLARGPRFRLPAETLRDQALAAAGLLSGKMYGRSVMPPQPEGVWQVVYNVQRWITSPGENRYRRALYTFWRRTSPYPGLALFDAPTRESCTAQRARSDTPAAALAMLNDPAYVEAAASLAGRMAREGGATEDSQLRYGWKLLLCGEPSVATLRVLRELRAKGDLASVACALLNLDEVLTKE